MRFTKYAVCFQRRVVFVFTSGKEAAIILAQAEQIQAGNEWRDVKKVMVNQRGEWVEV